jgi:hypothetical protein
LVNVTDANGCVITAILAPAVLTVNPVPSAPNTNTNACSEASVGFNLQHYLNFGGGNGVSADFSWYAISDNPLVSVKVLVPTTGNIITDVLTNNTTFPQSVTYRITATDCDGSLHTSTLDVIVSPAPEMTITQPPAVCSSPDLTILMTAVTIPGESYTYHTSLADAISGPNALSGTAITTATFDTYARYTISTTGCFATGLIEVPIGACVQVIAKAMTKRRRHAYLSPISMVD